MVQREHSAALQAQIDTLLLERDSLKERIQQLKVGACEHTFEPHAACHARAAHAAAGVHMGHHLHILLPNFHDGMAWFLRGNIALLTVSSRPNKRTSETERNSVCPQAKALAPNSASEMRMAHAVAESAQAAAAAAAAAASAASMCSIQVQHDFEHGHARPQSSVGGMQQAHAS